MSEWIKCKDRLPAQNGEYLTTTISYADDKKSFVKILRFATDLYDVDKHDFDDMAGMSGWYNYNSECGHYIITNVYAWQPLPEAYKED